MIDEAVGRVHLGHLSAGALEAIDHALDAETEAVDARMFRLIGSGTLDPQAALQAWFQKYAVFQLRRKLEQNVRAGQSSAARIKPMMNGETHADR